MIPGAFHSRGWQVRLTAGVVLAVALWAGAPAGAANSLGDHYLLLVTAFNPSTFTPDKIAQFEKSPYDGLAANFQNPYDTSPVPQFAEMSAKIAEWKKHTGKDLWPWVFLNRMIGPDPQVNNPHGQEPYFARIRGAALDQSEAAQKDFLLHWKTALAAAKASHSPGVVVDLEFYLNHRAYNPLILAQQMGKQPAEAVALLRSLGARMAEIAGAEYPDAIIWSLFTDLNDPRFAVLPGQTYYPSPAYVVMGLMDEARARKLAIKVISGGEVGLGYCHTTIEQLEMKMRNRAKDFSDALRKYNGTLELGGTLVLWNERAGKSEWMNDGFCGQSSAATVEELEPYLEKILRTYRYNWIYAAGIASYFPFQPQSAPRFDTVIRRAQQNSGRPLAR